jgi:hypothetical protein
MSEVKTWEAGELIGLLRSEIEYVEDFTETGRLDDVLEEIEKRLIQASEMLEKNLSHYEKEFIQQSSSFRPQTIYSIPKDIAKVLDKTETTDENFDIPKEVRDWVNELEDNYLDWVGRTFLVLAYCNPLTSPKAFPNIWKVE